MQPLSVPIKTTVAYDATSDTENVTETITKYAHTTNVSDAGRASDTYANNLDTTHTITIDGATQLTVTIYYDAESTSCDWVTVYQSPFNISSSNDATVSTTTGNLSGKLSDRNSSRTRNYSTWNTQTYTVSGDTVKFHFKSDASNAYYGYYAIVNGEVSTTVTTYSKTAISGLYATPNNSNSNLAFVGWTENQDGNGTIYTDESEVSTKLPYVNGDPTVTLYAVWAIYIQNATPADCGKTMYDKRDSDVKTGYTTAKIGDSCWMTTNLNLAGGTALSADDTDVTSDYINSFTTSNNLTKSGDTIVLPTSTTDSGFNPDKNSYVANSGNASSNCSTAPGCYSYYSWDAATLGSGRSISTDNTNTEQSICPKGWHLPTTHNGDLHDSTDFGKLMIALGGSNSIQIYNDSTSPTGTTMSSTLQASPNNFLVANEYYRGSFNRASRGYYWSATSYSFGSNTLFAQLLSFSPNGVSTTNYDYRGYGFSVRCVMNTPTR